MALGNALNFPALIDGVSQVLLTDVSASGNSNSQDIETFGGLVGFSNGVKKLEFSFTAAILQSGPEFDVIQAVSDESIHEVQIPYGPKSLVSSGTFKTFELGRSVNNPSNLQFTFTGDFKPPK